MYPDNIPAPRRRISPGAYIVSGLSFIPLLGVVFGLTGLLWAALSKQSGRLTVAIISLCGIGLTLGIYGWIFYQSQNPNGPFAPLKVELEKRLLVANVQAIEFYKLQTGRYPDALSDLQKQLPNGDAFGAGKPSASTAGFERAIYYRRVTDNTYELRGAGPDSQLFTPDDLFPDLGPDPRGQVGVMTVQP